MFADAALPVNVFGADMSVGPGGGGNASGGCKIAEVILYDRYLTEQERLDAERYLMAKWNCGTHPADKAPSVGTMTFSNGTPAVIDADVDMAIGTVQGSGTVVKKGTGAATIGTLAQNVSSLSVEGGTLSVTSGMPLADGAEVDVYLDAGGNASTFATAGALRLGGAVTVRLHAPTGSLLEYGDYDIASVSSIAYSGVGVGSRWTVDDSDCAHRGVAKIAFDASRGAVVLSVRPGGLTIILR